MVCAECFNNPGLKRFVEANAEDEYCDYCHTESDKAISVDLDQIAAHISSVIDREYGKANDLLLYDSREGGFQGEKWDTWDLLQDELGLDLPNDLSGELFQNIFDLVGDETWCKKEPGRLTETEELIYSWENFCRTVKHETRFFLDRIDASSNSETLSPTSTLSLMAERCKAAGLFVELGSGTEFYRARYFPRGDIPTNVLNLGPPPIDRAVVTNRMSAPGVVMLYVSDSPDTAIAETANGSGRFAIAKFKCARPLKILDLTNLPEIPCVFEAHSEIVHRSPTSVAIFLNHVAREIAKPIERDDRLHVEYTPTQVFTEFFKVVNIQGIRHLDGIRYSSSQREGHTSCVFFADQENMILPVQERPSLYTLHEDKWIELKSQEEYIHRVKADDLFSPPIQCN